MRVPFLARWPRRIPAGSARDEVAITMDLMPTILEVAGAPVPRGYQLHGVSLLSQLAGGPFERTDTLHWETQNNMAVRAGRWKLVHQFWDARPTLHDLASDPTEQADVSARFPEVVRALGAAHERWKARHYPDHVPHHTTRPSGRFPSP